MKQEWTDKLKDRLEGYSQPAPEGLWEDIESSLKAKRSPFRIVAPLLAGIAAAAAGIFVLMPHEAGPAIDVVESVPPVTADLMDLPEEVQPYTDATPIMEVFKKPSSVAVPDVPEYKEESEIISVQPVEEHPAEKPETSKPANRKTKEIIEETTLDFPTFTEDNETRSSKRQRVSIGLHTGGMSANSSGDAAHPFMHQDAVYGYYLAASPNDFRTVSKVSVNDYDWNISMQIDALARLYLTDRFSVASGVSLTVLDGIQELTQNSVKAGYVGIPLEMNYDILKVGRFRLGVNAGATAESCLKAPRNLEMNKWQLSANAGISGLYQAGRRTGIQAGIGSETFFAAPGGEPGMFRQATTMMRANLGLVWMLF